MDRTLKVYTKTDHLFAEFTFLYEHVNQAKVRYTQYRRLYNDDEEDEGKAVFPLMEMESYLDYRQFDSIDQIKVYDKEVVKNHLGRDMTDPSGYNYVYNAAPVLLRYIAANHIGFIGMVNIVFSFIDNNKEVKFLSGTNPRYDTELTSNSLETNISCILRIPVYTQRDITSISIHDLKRLEPWY
jgi:hypothetical protein